MEALCCDQRDNMEEPDYRSVRVAGPVVLGPEVKPLWKGIGSLCSSSLLHHASACFCFVMAAHCMKL